MNHETTQSNTQMKREDSSIEESSLESDVNSCALELYLAAGWRSVLASGTFGAWVAVGSALK
jgi:hypothetical protein